MQLSECLFVPTCSGFRSKDLTCLHSEHKDQNNTINTASSSSPEPDTPSFNYSELGYEKAQEPRSFPTLPSGGNSEEQPQREYSNHGYKSCDLQHEGLVSTVDSQLFKNAEMVMEGPNHTNTSADVSGSAEQTDCPDPPKPCECQTSAADCTETLGGRKEKVQEDTGGVRVEERTQRLEVGSGGPRQKNVPYICCYGVCCHGSRPGLDDFKEFLQGKPGEKTFNLWMDIERLKLAQNQERKNR